ncbi:MAG TPA: DUF4143 domain-containing protein [Candidatus Babeliales bacterium]|nr:DUF4143 domain-containing protein [Candidatus Babeliales bacterium]
MRFLLTGSTARGLRRSGVNLLAGRALTYHMHPLIEQELDQSFHISQVLRYGSLPSIFDHADPEKYLQSYVQTYIREEVIQEGLIRNISAFARFLETASFSQGQILNISEIARELSLNRLLVSAYFDILEDLLLAIRILPFTHRAKRKIIAHQKFYFFDVGVYNAIRPRGPLDTIQEAEGAGLETFFLQSLRAVNDYYSLNYSIFFWRTAIGQEVDFILYGPRGLYAFELKRSEKITPKSLKGLKSFGQDYPEAKKFLIYQGEHPQYHGDITILPITEALRTLPEILT